MSTAVAESAWCVVVPHHARGARQARHRLTAALTGNIPATLLADVISVAAELIANAVRHAEPLPGGVVRLAWRLRTSDGKRMVEVRVTDGGAISLPRPRAASIDEADGRGLKIVEALADRWGVDKDGLGQSVWAELS
ncbi:MAG TPA: ATP-binding protein [Candidatus Limnocylindrales bacterium]|nr:ATP-binding protein [Candidatus Limnocylindrales bacterium]